MEQSFTLKVNTEERMNPQDISRLQELEESLWRSETRFDMGYMEKVLAPDFMEFGRSGRVYSRDEIMGDITPSDIKATLPLPNFEAHLISDSVALVTYVSEIGEGSEVVKGNRSSLWLKSDEGWRIRFHQGTPSNG